MSFFRPAMAATLALGLSALPATAQTERPSLWDVFSVENIVISTLHGLLSTARVLADIQYDQISVDPVALRVTLTGVTASPLMPGVASGVCTITAQRVTLSGGAIDRISETRFRMALDGVEVATSCFPREASAMAQAMGFRSFRADRIDTDTTYSHASGGAVTRLSLEVPEVVSIAGVVDMAYISYRMNLDTEEPVFSVDLSDAEFTVQDRGAWALAKNFLPPNMLEPAALGQIVTGAVQSMMQDANGFEDNALSARQTAFAEQAGQLAAGFDAGPRQIVLTTGVEPAPFRLNEDSLRDFRPFFDRLNPSLQTTAPALERTVPVAELSAILGAETPGEEAFALGRALITGVGAPRNLAEGLRLLVPAARAGNAEASLLIAEAAAETKPADAYSHALLATAAGLPGSLALLDRIERSLPYGDAIAAQNAQMAGPDAALYSDLSAMRAAARGFLIGTDRPRSWRAAYYWASMAAAAGDATSAALRDEITETMRLRGDALAWAGEAESLENGVLRDWIGRDVPAQLR